MISQGEVLAIFGTHLPTDVHIEFLPLREFVDKSLESPFIQRQIEVGIYNLSNIYDDFLSPACSYVQQRYVEVCYDLLVAHAEGVEDEALIRAYVVSIAQHEAHHFHQNLLPVTWQEHAYSELECIHDAFDPEMERDVELFQEQSVVYSRVFGRLGGLERAATSGG